MNYFFGYLTVINIISVIVCCYDKLQAVKGGRRISEKTLLNLSICGGSIGMFVTMKIIRHKTKHRKFMLGIPAIIAVQALLFVIIYMNIK